MHVIGIESRKGNPIPLILIIHLYDDLPLYYISNPSYSPSPSPSKSKRYSWYWYWLIRITSLQKAIKLTFPSLQLGRLLLANNLVYLNDFIMFPSHTLSAYIIPITKIWSKSNYCMHESVTQTLFWTVPVLREPDSSFTIRSTCRYDRIRRRLHVYLLPIIGLYTIARPW